MGRRGSEADGRRRSRSPQGEGRRLRDELIDATNRLLARTGDEEGLSLRAVAREAGIAAPSIYLHFANKDELITTVMLEHFAGLRQAVEAAVEAAPDSAAKLRAGCLAYCRFGLDQPAAYRVMFGNRTSAFADRPWAEVPGVDTFLGLVGGVAASIAAGVGRPSDPTRVATAVWTALHGIVTLRTAVPMFPWPPVEDLVDNVLVGLVGLPPRPDRAGDDAAGPEPGTAITTAAIATDGGEGSM